jgi:hypothetical protein
MTEKEKKSVRIDYATWKDISHQSTETGRDIYELIADAWAVFREKAVAPVSTKPVGAEYPYPGREEWHAMLDRILTRGTDRQKLGIQSNLEAFDANLPHARPKVANSRS